MALVCYTPSLLSLLIPSLSQPHSPSSSCLPLSLPEASVCLPLKIPLMFTVTSKLHVVFSLCTPERCLLWFPISCLFLPIAVAYCFFSHINGIDTSNASVKTHLCSVSEAATTKPFSWYRKRLLFNICVVTCVISHIYKRTLKEKHHVLYS